MHILKISAAIALMAGSLGLTTAASAQRYEERRDRIERIERAQDRAERRGDRRDNRRYGRSRREEARRYERSRRRELGARRAYRQPGRCRTIWRNQRRIRVCR